MLLSSRQLKKRSRLSQQRWRDVRSGAILPPSEVLSEFEDQSQPIFLFCSMRFFFLFDVRNG